VLLFVLFSGDRQVGFVAIEKADNNLYYMEKLAVLPEYRHKGYGTRLVRFVLDYIKNKGGKKLSTGIIDEHTILKNWYKGMGFKEISTQKFPHLPFTVCFMEKELF
jgi:ribosomal protein S18 acetylase RimI-like enzyme